MLLLLGYNIKVQRKPGTYQVSWDGLAYPSGVYFYKITTNEYSDVKKMILMK